MNFAESTKYLLSLGNEVSAMKLGLENTRGCLGALDNPHDNYLKVQVAGTNGKGSVCVFLDAICASAAISTGLFTSPHLVSITERIKINGIEISEDDFARHASRVRETAERLLAASEIEYRPTFFEQVTAIALTAFAEAGVDLAILETGLGGRLDATTAANAEIAGITRIDCDHQEYLGETLAEIAGEKAAIIRNGATVVIGQQNDEAMQVIVERCQQVGSAPRFASEVIEVGSPPRSFITVETPAAAYLDICLGLLGRHQIENAKVAILLAEALQDHFAITTKNIIDGLARATHPGRLEFDGQYLFDGAHNPSGARSLAAFLDESVDRPVTLVFGAMRGKDIGEITGVLFPRATKVILTRPANTRAMATGDILPLVPDATDARQIFVTATAREALGKAREVTPDDGIILVTGSLYLVGEAKSILNSNSKFEI